MRHVLLLCLAFAVVPWPLAADEAQVQPKDTLWDLSKKTQGEHALWPLLYQDNQDLVDDPQALRIGQELRIGSNHSDAEKAQARKRAGRYQQGDEKAWTQPAPQPTPQAAPSPEATAVLTPAATPQPTPAAALPPAVESLRPGLSVGVGWPEAKVRYGFAVPIDLEAKAAFGEGMQVYSGRVYWTYYEHPILSLMAGVEGGYMNLQGAEGLYGAGAHGGLFTGIEVPVNRWLKLSVDLGPDFLEAHADNQSVNNVEWVVTTGVYLRVF